MKEFLSSLDRRARFLPTLAALFVSGMVLIGGLYFLTADGAWHGDFLRDRSLSDIPFSGIYSDLGVALMLLSSVMLFFAWRLSRERSLGLLAVFCLVFALDDGLMLHEQIGSGELALFAVYGLLVGFAYICLQQLIVWPLIGVLGCFAFSVLIDVLLWDDEIASQLVMRYRFLLEDGAKFCGIFLMTVFSVSEYARILNNQALDQ